MKSLRAALLYFAVVFGVGFVLGVVRVFWIVPRVGARTAELLETPVIVAVAFAAARWVVRRLTLPPAVPARLGMGLGALALMLAAEFGFVMRLRGMTIGDYIATRDPVSGAAYALGLALFGLMPLLVGKGAAPRAANKKGGAGTAPPSN